MQGSILPVILILGLGGVIIWYVLQTPPAQPKPCGIPVSAYGAGTVIPCGAIKEVAEGVKKAVVSAPSAVKAVVSTPYNVIAGQRKVSLFATATGQDTTSGLKINFPPKV
jgi:hypothetical protein